MEAELHEKMQELGYGCLTSREEFREFIMNFRIQNINTMTIAKVLGKGSSPNFGRIRLFKIVLKIRPKNRPKI